MTSIRPVLFDQIRRNPFVILPPDGQVKPDNAGPAGGAGPKVSFWYRSSDLNASLSDAPSDLTTTPNKSF